MHRWKELVQITEMVLAELSGRVTERFESSAKRYRLIRDADVSAGLSDGCQSRPYRHFAGDEVGAPRRAARFGIVVGEPHPFGREPVEVRSLPRHDALVIGTDVEPAHIVAHDDEDVGSALLLLLRGRWHTRDQHRQK